jgi:hypothetical protein
MLFLFLALVSSVASHELYNFSSIESSGAGLCLSTERLREIIHEDVELFATNSEEAITVTRLCGCGGPGWRRAAYLNMSDPIQTCPPQLGSSLLLQEDPVLDLFMLAVCHVIQLCSLLKIFSTLRSVEESLDISLDIHKYFILKTLINHKQLMVRMLME